MLKTFDHGGTIFAVARALNVSPDEITDFSASINPLGPPPGVREAVSAAFDRVVHYPESDCPELGDALALRHGLTAGNFVAANGSTELIYLLPRLVPGKRALVIAPPFSEYARALTREGWRTDYFTLMAGDGFTLPVDRLDEELERGYDLVIIANPGNPTGKLYPPSDMAALYLLCREHGAFLVIDEAFMDFCEEGSTKGLAAGEEGILLLRSMTKFYALPGLRLGYAIGAHGTISRLAQLREPWSVNSIAQAAGIAALADPAYGERTRQTVDGERRRLFAGLQSIPPLSPYPGRANYLLVELTAGPTAAELAALLLEERLLIRDCSSFRGLGERFFRVAVRTRQENDRLLELLGGLLGR